MCIPPPIVPNRYRGTMTYHKVFCRLIQQAAADGPPILYRDVAGIMGLPAMGQHMGAETGHILGEISEDEHNQQRPMLSALVVRADTDIPGDGFFALARQLGRLAENATQEEQEQFWQKELRRVYRTWQ